ncbi:MAG TPA: hypothetical protein VHO03_17195 [Ignavibacteriales bacterium]|nr:hypothetical protein [Ignavibacteriales bacterium]
MQYSKCRICHEEIIFAQNTQGKFTPINAASLTMPDKYLLGHGQVVPFRPGKHVLHFRTCTNPMALRKKKTYKSQKEKKAVQICAELPQLVSTPRETCETDLFEGVL